MTREKAANLWPVIKAYSEGKEIQISKRLDGEYRDIDGPYFDSSDSFYRIKPEKKLVPFTFEDADFLLGKTVVLKSTKSKRVIVGVLETGVICGNAHWSFQEFLDEYTFNDGMKCGKYLEE